MSETLANILYSGMSASTRIVAMDIALSGTLHPDSRHYVLDSDATVKAISERVHLSTRTVSDALHSLVDAGVVAWERSCVPEGAKNKYGERIPINAASRAHGDFIAWQHASILSMPIDVAIPEVMPERKNVERARVRAASERQRVRQMQDELQALLSERECPSCGSHGALQADVRATCSTCGEIFDADELDALLDTPAIPATPMPDESQILDELAQTGTDRKKFRCSASVQGEDSSDALKEESQTLDKVQRVDSACDPDNIELDVPDSGVETLADVPVKSFHAPEECDSVPEILDSVPEELVGVDSIVYLSCMGVRAYARQRVIGTKKAGYDSSWLDTPMSEHDAIEHLRRSTSHLVGILPEHGDVDVLDIDAGLDAFFELNPNARRWCRVQRVNAPDRAKFIFKIAGARMRHMVRESLDKCRKVELMGVRHSGVVAGIHPSGAPYVLVTGEIPTLSESQVREMLDAFVPAAPVPAAPVRSASTSSSTSGSAAKRAIQYWLSVPANVAATLALIERRPHVGKHFSLRDADSTPSAMLTSDDAVHDYGTGAHYDLFDVWCMLTNTNKRSAIHDAYMQMRAQAVTSASRT